MLKEFSEAEKEFIRVFDLQDDKSETAYYTGTMEPQFHDVNLWKLMILGTHYPEFYTKPCNTKQEYIDEVLKEFIKIGEPVKEAIQKIFNSWRF